ncbi:hypothetical protein H6G97_39975 [Nostoc flagelliforme FACHB-838]|uniref:Transposase n=1 Tax=Nostoc flagelliforme FACHB-838 TaxID=2692904 RepID=A0ABR8E3S0_9NOSO|nr:hypothetical protein [Nostoc flagelliforme FACHB-838]
MNNGAILPAVLTGAWKKHCGKNGTLVKRKSLVFLDERVWGCRYWGIKKMLNFLTHSHSIVWNTTPNTLPHALTTFHMNLRAIPLWQLERDRRF